MLLEIHCQHVVGCPQSRNAVYQVLSRILFHYPVAERLSRTRDDGLIVVTDTRPAGAIAGLGGTWGAVSMDGRRSTAVVSGAPEPERPRAPGPAPRPGAGSALAPRAARLVPLARALSWRYPGRVCPSPRTTYL